LSELHRNAGGGDALQRSAADVDATDAVDFKVEADDRKRCFQATALNGCDAA
jgi:hypothetical protein